MNEYDTISAFVGVQYSVNFQNARCNNKDMLVVVYRHFGKAFRSHLQKSAVRAVGTDRLRRNFSEKLPT
jgi:hypothetical protein